jgi:hypothetical protein
VTYEAKGKSARCLVSVGAARTAKASSEGWRLRLRPNKHPEFGGIKFLSYDNPNLGVTLLYLDLVSLSF